MTRWENTSVYRALGTLSALPVRALSRLPLKAGKRRCGLSFSQWFLLLGMGAMLCVPHGRGTISMPCSLRSLRS